MNSKTLRMILTVVAIASLAVACGKKGSSSSSAQATKSAASGVKKSAVSGDAVAALDGDVSFVGVTKLDGSAISEDEVEAAVKDCPALGTDLAAATAAKHAVVNSDGSVVLTGEDGALALSTIAAVDVSIFNSSGSGSGSSSGQGQGQGQTQSTCDMHQIGLHLQTTVGGNNGSTGQGQGQTQGQTQQAPKEVQSCGFRPVLVMNCVVPTQEQPKATPAPTAQPKEQPKEQPKATPAPSAQPKQQPKEQPKATPAPTAQPKGSQGQSQGKGTASKK